MPGSKRTEGFKLLDDIRKDLFAQSPQGAKPGGNNHRVPEESAFETHAGLLSTGLLSKAPHLADDRSPILVQPWQPFSRLHPPVVCFGHIGDGSYQHEPVIEMVNTLACVVDLVKKFRFRGDKVIRREDQDRRLRVLRKNMGCRQKDACARARRSGPLILCRMIGCRAKECEESVTSDIVTGLRQGRRQPSRACVLLLAGGAEALEFLEPALDEDHFGDGRGLPLVELDH